MLTCELLIEKGYFPQECIPPLHTEQLKKALPGLLPSLHTLLKVKKTSKSKCCTHSIPRPKGFRRALSIPNPLHQIALSRTVAGHWLEIEAYCRHSTLSVSTPVVDVDKPRAISPIMEYGAMNEERIMRSTAARYLLQLDIARFYHSIYTHSIAWALHTKTTAKDNHSRLLLGNALDEDLRNTRDAQTVGLPIGPDTSRIISEIVGVAIDVELQNRLGSVTGVRYVDDYYLYFTSLGNLQVGYAVMQGVLSEYELELNPAKALVVELPESLEDIWVRDLQQFRFRDKEPTQRADLISYFDLVYRNAAMFPDDSVIQYALKKISKVIIAPTNFGLYEALLLKTIMVEPRALPIVLGILLLYTDHGYSLDKKRIASTAQELLSEQCKLNNGFEVSWTLWLCKSLGIVIDNEILDLLSKVMDPVVALVALDLQHSGQTRKKLDNSIWRQFAGKNALYSENWLLAYEASLKGWMPMHDPALISDPFFGMLEANNVEFYESRRQIKTEDIFVDSLTSSLPFQIPEHLLGDDAASFF